MPIVGFWCQNCAEPADEAHYAPWSPCESGITAGHIQNIMMHGDGRPTSGWSVTQIKGCLRSVIIERTEKCIVDPAAYLLMELGSAWDHWITRREGPKVRWHGTLGGLEISGEPDGWRAYDPQEGPLGEPIAQVIWDYKNGTAPRTGDGKGYTQGVWDDHRWQVSLYAFISPYTFDHGYIFYNAYGGKAGKVCKRRFDLIRSEEALLAHKMSKGWDVAENIYRAKQLEGHPAADYPLTGRSIPMGKKTLCDWCTVRDRCEELDGSVGI